MGVSVSRGLQDGHRWGFKVLGLGVKSLCLVCLGFRGEAGFKVVVAGPLTVKPAYRRMGKALR